MPNASSYPMGLASPEALQNQQQYLIETIGHLMDIMKSVPPGNTRAKMLDEICRLDVIAEVMRKALKDY